MVLNGGGEINYCNIESKLRKINYLSFNVNISVIASFKCDSHYSDSVDE